MAVIVKYVVVRNGKEVMTFTTKKEADAHDKTLDIAELLLEFLQSAETQADEKSLDDLAFFIAKNREQVGKLLKGVASRSSLDKTLSETASADKTSGVKKPDKAKTSRAKTPGKTSVEAA